jgi:hypothetical protein
LIKILEKLSTSIYQMQMKIYIMMILIL